MSSTSVPFFITTIIIFFHPYNVRSQFVTCDGGPCTCPSFASPGTVCILDCGQEDLCREQTLTCRPNDPCILKCDNKASCKSGTIIRGGHATDVTIVCGATDSCADDITIICGTGACKLECETPSSCTAFGTIDVSRARSFECIGDCPLTLPYAFSPSPTPAPTSAPSDAPSYSPSSAPTYSPTRSPSKTPTQPPTTA